MAQDIGSILQQKEFFEPPEIDTIRRFVEDNLKVTPRVSLQQTTIVIAVPSAAVAGALRPYLHELQDLCQTDKRLIIRIGR